MKTTKMKTRERINALYYLVFLQTHFTCFTITTFYKMYIYYNIVLLNL